MGIEWEVTWTNSLRKKNLYGPIGVELVHRNAFERLAHFVCYYCMCPRDRIPQRLVSIGSSHLEIKKIGTGIMREVSYDGMLIRRKFENRFQIHVNIVSRWL